MPRACSGRPRGLPVTHCRTRSVSYEPTRAGRDGTPPPLMWFVSRSPLHRPPVCMSTPTPWGASDGQSPAQVTFRPRGLSPPRRVAPHTRSRVYCTPQPVLRFMPFPTSAAAHVRWPDRPRHARPFEVSLGGSRTASPRPWPPCRCTQSHSDRASRTTMGSSNDRAARAHLRREAPPQPRRAAEHDDGRPKPNRMIRTTDLSRPGSPPEDDDPRSVDRARTRYLRATSFPDRVGQGHQLPRGRALDCGALLRLRGLRSARSAKRTFLPWALIPSEAPDTPLRAHEKCTSQPAPQQASCRPSGSTEVAPSCRPPRVPCQGHPGPRSPHKGVCPE